MGEFKIELRHFTNAGNYNTGVPFVTRELWWRIGGQTKNVITHPHIIAKNGVGEDIVFARTILSKINNPKKFVIMKNALLLIQSSESRKETHWNSHVKKFPNLTLPFIQIEIEKLIKYFFDKNYS